MMTEQAGPQDLVTHAVRAEEAGFDFSVTSDHYFPWLDEQGHSPYAWSVLGAAAQATSKIPLMSYVTSRQCDTTRRSWRRRRQRCNYSPAAASGWDWAPGEKLNEHVVGGGWPATDIRQQMLAEAVEIIGALFGGGYVNHHGAHFDVESARLWALPDSPPPLGVAVSGQRSCELAGRLADLMIAVDPDPNFVTAFEENGGAGQPRVGQLPVCHDADRRKAGRRAHEQFRWFGGGWKVNSELPGTAAFAAASAYVREEDVADSIPCGDDPEVFARAVRPYVEAGFTEIALVQVGGASQLRYLDWAEKTLLPALREL